jgi:hypothetical protein
MKIAIEKDNKIKFFIIDGRKLSLFLKQAEEVNGKLDEVWTYTGIKRDSKSSIGVFENVKKITKDAELTDRENPNT